mgnify:CR=1 FL=1
MFKSILLGTLALLALGTGELFELSKLAYGGARLPDDLYDRFQALAVRTTGERFVFYTGWGSTETAPTSTGSSVSAALTTSAFR